MCAPLFYRLALNAEISVLNRFWPKLVSKYVQDTMRGLRSDAYFRGCLDLVERSAD